MVQLKYQLKADDDKLSCNWKNKSGEWEITPYTELDEDELKKEWICVRTQFQLKYSVENVSTYQEQLHELVKTTRTKICATHKPVLKVSGTEIVLKKDKGLVGIGKNAKISAALQQTKAGQTAASNTSNQFDVLNIEIFPGDDEAAAEDISSKFSSRFTANFAIQNV